MAIFNSYVKLPEGTSDSSPSTSSCGALEDSESNAAAAAQSWMVTVPKPVRQNVLGTYGLKMIEMPYHALFEYSSIQRYFLYSILTRPIIPFVRHEVLHHHTYRKNRSSWEQLNSKMSEVPTFAGAVELQRFGPNLLMTDTFSGHGPDTWKQISAHLGSSCLTRHCRTLFIGYLCIYIYIYLSIYIYVHDFAISRIANDNSLQQ